MKGKKKHKMLRIKVAGGTLDGIFPVRVSDGHRMINRRAAQPLASAIRRPFAGLYPPAETNRLWMIFGGRIFGLKQRNCQHRKAQLSNAQKPPTRC